MSASDTKLVEAGFEWCQKKSENLFEEGKGELLELNGSLDKAYQ